MVGWIKIHRKIVNHWVWKNDKYLKAWLTMVMLVNYEDRTDLIEGELIECKRGQSLYSLKTWAQKFGSNWSIQNVRTFFRLLEIDQMVKTEGLRKTTRVTVCNYDDYQDSQQTNNTEPTWNQHGANTEPTTTKEVKKERSKEIKKEDINISSMNNITFQLNEWAKPFFNEKFIGDRSYDVFDKLIRIDNYKPDEIKEAIKWARNDNFWSTNFLSPLKLRNKDKNGVKYIDIFLAKILTNGKNRSNNNQGASAEQLAETFIKYFGGQE